MIAEVVASRRTARLSSKLSSELSSVAPEYREVLNEAVDTLQGFKAATKTNPNPNVEDAIARDLFVAWRDIWTEANELVGELSDGNDAMSKVKAATEMVLTPFFLTSTLWHQAIRKPLGYPGDYQLMSRLYEAEILGSTAFERGLDSLGYYTGEFVGSRMQSVKQAVDRTVGTASNTARPRICSLGCGPAREVVEHIRDTPESNAEFILIDQDENALQKAADDSNDVITRETSGRGDVTINIRNVSVSRLLRRAALGDLIAGSDLIYAVGLFDYFGDRTCKTLTHELFRHLKPGGQLIVGNMKRGSDLLWPLEYICDWSLNYRTADEVLMWADGLKDVSIDLRTEGTGHDFLLHLTKV